MMHSVKFAELRTLLSEVLQSEAEMREALKEYRGSSTRESPEYSPSGSQGFLPASSNSSPRLGGQLAFGGSSMDSSGETGISGMTAHGRGGLSVDELADSLRLPPRLLAQSTSLLGGRQPKKDMGKRVDFGFRPDGAGEDSVESWSLFKVSKGSMSSAFSDSVSTGLGLTTSTGFDKMRRSDQKVRLQRPPVDCDFHEYMAQSRPAGEASWNRSSSAPSLVAPGQKKTCPKLPKLLHSKSGSRSNLTSANSVSGFTTSGTGFKSKGDVLGTWAKAPPKCPSVPNLGNYHEKFGQTALAFKAEKFAATAPPSGGFPFGKWSIL